MQHRDDALRQAACLAQLRLPQLPRLSLDEVEDAPEDESGAPVGGLHAQPAPTETGLIVQDELPAPTPGAAASFPIGG